MKLFREQHLHDQLLRDGFAIFQFLNSEELALFGAYVHQLKEQGKLQFKNGIHISGEIVDFRTKAEISERICSHIQPALERSFSDTKLFQGSFIIKEGNSAENAIYPHQDWSFVDEQKGEASYTLWAALTDITEEMGCIELVRGSHLFPSKIRYTPNEAFHSDEENRLLTEGLLFERFKLLKGYAVIWDHRLIHRSAPNRSEKPRINLALAITGANYGLKLWWKNPGSDHILEFDVEDDFYKCNNSQSLLSNYLKGQYPNGKLRKTIPSKKALDVQKS